MILFLNPPEDQRAVTLSGQTFIPLGTTEHGWECSMLQLADGRCFAIICDGLTRHCGGARESPEAALLELAVLVTEYENIAVCAWNETAEFGTN